MNDDNEQQGLDDDWEEGDEVDGEAADDDYEGEADGEDEDEVDAEGESAAEGPNGASTDDADKARPRRRRRRRREGAREQPLPDDERAREALAFVTNVVREMGMDCRVRLRRTRGPDEGGLDEINIEIAGKDAGRIIGKKGQVLAALQFLVHRAVNRPGMEKRHILVDAEGYRSRRDDSLALMARRLGKQAVELGKIITFEPMNPRDRRVVHLALAKFEGVITKSDGEGDQRRVQIIPVRRSAS
jgi:spoIIIJ-associated protein